MKVTHAQLNLLVRTLQTGSVGAAARALGLTQSGASQALASLEKALGAELLTRSRSGVTATAFARSILPDAEIAVAAVQRIADKGRLAAAAPAGSLRLASVPSLAGRLVPGWCRRFRQLYPGCEIGVFEGNHEDINAWVAQGIADIGLTSIRPAGLTAEPLGREELLVVARRGDPVARREAVPLALLGERPIILASGCEPIVSTLFEQRSLAPPPGVRTQTMAAALEMVRQGLGLALFPETAFPRAGMEGLRIRPVAPAAYRDLHLVSRLDGAPSEAVSRFLDFVASAEGRPGHERP